MKKPVSKALRKRNLVIRLYIAVLSIMLGISLTALLSQSALATTYVITDGERVVTYTTFATDPAQVLEEAGLTLGDADSYTTAQTQGAQTIAVSRAQTITLRYHGQTTMVTGTGETVGELLDRLGVPVSGEDVVSHGREEPLRDGMVICVDRYETVQETYAALVRHETLRCTDSTLPQGREEILTPGVDAQVQRTAQVTYCNGREISRTVLSETVTCPGVTEVIAVGTGDEALPQDCNLPVITDSTITLPSGEVLTYTKKDTVEATAYTHTDEGCDYTTATGTTVRWGTVAVDPRYIPYGTRMFIMASDGSYVYGLATAEDCGGDIKGDRMDLYMPTFAQCIDFGRRRCTLYFLG